MKRTNLIKLHISLASFFLSFLVIMPLSGTGYLLGFKGKADKKLVFSTTAKLENTKDYFISELKKQNIDFHFEYIKNKGNSYILRPSNREHYVAVKTDAGVDFYLYRPNLMAKLVELHKGHGPTLFKKLETIFGIGLILVTLSGAFLIFGLQRYYKLVTISVGSGLVILVLTLTIY